MGYHWRQKVNNKEVMATENAHGNFQKRHSVNRRSLCRMNKVTGSEHSGRNEMLYLKE